MTTKEVSKQERVQELEAKAEEISQEVDELASQLRDADSQIAKAKARFAQLDEERKVLAPKVFGGDSKAQLELEALEDEYDETARSVRVAEAARPELARMLEEAKARLKASRRAIHEAKAWAITSEIKSLDGERDAAADRLVEVLEKQQKLRSAHIHEVNSFDQDQANALVTNPNIKPGYWIKQRFSRWL